MAFMNNTTSKRIAKPNQKKLTTQKLNEMLNRRKLAATSKGFTIITPQKKKEDHPEMQTMFQDPSLN